MIDMDIDCYSVCSCGAITLSINGQDYSVPKSKLKQYLPDLDLRQYRYAKLENTYACDYCVNHYGMDLCGCGSGAKFGKCNNNLEECHQIMQIIGKYTRVFAKHCWC